MASVSGYDTCDLMGASREVPLPFMRFCIWRVLHEHGWSTPKIGAMFSRDHATVIHGLKVAHDCIGRVTFESETDLYYRFKCKIMSDKEMFMESFNFMRERYADLEMRGTRVYYRGVLQFDSDGSNFLYNMTRLVETLKDELI